MNKGIYDIGIVVPYSLLATSQFMDLRLTDSFCCFFRRFAIIRLGIGSRVPCSSCLDTCHTVQLTPLLGHG